MTDIERTFKILLEAKFCPAKAQLLIVEMAGMIKRKSEALTQIEVLFKNKRAADMTAAERKAYSLAQGGNSSDK